MELTLVGLQNSGKTTLVNVIAVSTNLCMYTMYTLAIIVCVVAYKNDIYIYIFIQSGQFIEDSIPTVGFNMRKVTKGNVTMKLWDIGGQPRFRSMWERYCRGVNAIV